MTTHLTDSSVRAVLTIIDGWTDLLTWEALREAVILRIGFCPTRQALSKQKRIASAFRKKKKKLANAPDRPKARRVDPIRLLEKLDRLESENERLSSENQLLLDQFRRWAYNASTAGISFERLNAALPKVDREHPK